MPDPIRDVLPWRCDPGEGAVDADPARHRCYAPPFMRTVVNDDLGPEGVDASEEGKAADDSAARTRRRLPSWTPTAGMAAAVCIGIVARFVQRSPLWLDEALSVNIARLPVSDLLDALRHDGHPPLYYLVLHFWMEVVGESDVAVRALSGIISVATLPLAWVAGRRLAGTNGARWAVVALALSPFAVRYGTETRMYALVMLLVLAGYLLLTDALERPTWARLGGIAAISGLLLLSHYWAFYLVAAVGGLLVLRAWRRPAGRAATVRVAIAVAAGGVLFLPWLGGFLYQSAHTGTPWGRPFRPTAILQTTLIEMGGGSVTEAALYGGALLVLALLGLLAVRTAGPLVDLDMRTAPTVRWELAVVTAVIAVGTVVGYATNATYQGRYAATVVPLVLLAVAVGLARLQGTPAFVAGGAFVALSLFGIVWVNYFQRTQSAEVAAEVRERAEPGDVVVYCPDQLGPAYSREMPDGLVQMVYPTLAAPARVDWVDYAERNEAADVRTVAQDIVDEADGHAVFMVWMTDYNTYDTQCEELVNVLGLTENLVVPDSSKFFEPAYLHWSPAPAGAGLVGSSSG
jgi:mannosyltransferase